MSSHRPSLSVLFPVEQEPWTAFLKRIQATKGEVLVLLTGREGELLSAGDRSAFLDGCTAMRARLRMALRDPDLVADLRRRGVRVVDRTRDLRQLLDGHEKLPEALRTFPPHKWRQQLKSRLQSIGLLSLPRLRIYLLVGVSLALFTFVVFRLLPSATIRVKARANTISQTTNMYLVQSGAQVTLPSRSRVMELVPLTVTVNKKLTYTNIRRESIGSAAQVPMTVINGSAADTSLRKGTRFVNQAGMVFRIQQSVVIPAGSERTVRAKADDLDLYGQIIGERGNVLPGLEWEIPGLPEAERKLIRGQNRAAGTGGATEHRVIVKQEDIDAARQTLEHEMEAEAKMLVERERTTRNERDPGKTLQSFDYLTSLIKKEFGDFTYPQELLGQPAESIEVSGSLRFTVVAYDAQEILSILRDKLKEHVRDGKQLQESSLTLDNLEVRVIYYDDDLRWVKLTADLTGSEQFVLDPLSPTGALFGKTVRTSILGQSKRDALRILKNMPEVDDAEISLWPPWSQSLPPIPSHITIEPW